MAVLQERAESGFGTSVMASAVIHVAVFLLVIWWGRLFPENTALQETYYVDVVNLPVASPRAGHPSQKGDGSEAPPPPRPADSPMKAPGATQPASKGQDKKAVKGEAESEAAFAEKMAKIAKKADAQHEQEVLDQLRKKVSGSGRSGMPAATGTQAGSDYTAYLQSRLKDAFRETISYSTKNPEMIVRLFIDTDGKLSRYKAERSSGDRAFELSVYRAIDMAKEKFKEPPNRKVFEGVFVFRPQGITPNKP